MAQRKVAEPGRPAPASAIAVYSPGDLVAARPSAQRLRLAGRVVGSPRAGTLLVADALGTVLVELTKAEPARAGDLVQVAGKWNGQRFVQARLLSLTSLPETTGRGEFARFGWRGVGRHLAQRSAAYAAIRAYFAECCFIEVTTPLRVRTPGLDANVNALRAKPDWLSTSPELQMKRLLVGGVPRIFQIAPCFRADELGTLHEPEFTMLEWYRAFQCQEAVMHDTEQLVLRVVRTISGRSFIRYQGRKIDVTPPFARLSVPAAFRRFANVDDCVALAAVEPARFFELFASRVEPALARRKKPIFLTDYPISQAALARPRSEAPELAERFELYLAGVELCNGFSELTDASEQRRRFQAERRARRRTGQPVYALDERFLAALDEGMPPAGGNALGLDRLLMLASEANSIADVMSFPEAWR